MFLLFARLTHNSVRKDNLSEKIARRDPLDKVPRPRTKFNKKIKEHDSFGFFEEWNQIDLG